MQKGLWEDEDRDGKTSGGLLVADKYKKVEDTSRGDGDIWGPAVAVLKNGRKENITIQKCHCTDIIHR